MTASDLAADVRLTDAEIAHIRPVQPSDEEALHALYARQSSRSVFFRYFTVSRTIADRDVDRIVRPDAEDHLDLVAELEGELVAVAGYEVLDDPTTAEIAFLVDDDHHHLGLGTLLFEQLVAAALDRGITTFIAETLPQNADMLGIFQAAGLPLRIRYDQGCDHVEIDLVEA